MKPQIIDRYVYVKGKKISEVDNKTILDGTEKVPLAQNDVNYSTTVDTISNYVDSVHDYLTTEDYNDLKGQIDSERTNRQEADNELNQSIQDTKSELHSTISNVESELLNEVSDLQEQIDNINTTGIANGVTLDTVQTITGEKTFTIVPKSTASATSDNDLTNKNYVDTAISEALGDTISDVVTTNTAQEIRGLKTFKTLPKGDGTPTASNDLVTKQYVDDAVANADVDLDGYATQAWVNEQGFAKTSDLPEGIEIGETTGTAFDGGRGKAVEDKMNKLPRYIRGNIINNLDGNDSVRYDTDRVRLFFTTWDTSTGKINHAGFTKYIDAATSENAGVMSASDKKKLDSIPTLTTSGDGTKYLSDNGTYKTIETDNLSDSFIIYQYGRYTVEQVDNAVKEGKKLYYCDGSDPGLNADHKSLYPISTYNDGYFCLIWFGNNNYNNFPIYFGQFEIIDNEYPKMIIRKNLQIKGDGSKYLNDSGEYEDIVIIIDFLDENTTSVTKEQFDIIKKALNLNKPVFVKYKIGEYDGDHYVPVQMTSLRNQILLTIIGRDQSIYETQFIIQEWVFRYDYTVTYRSNNINLDLSNYVDQDTFNESITQLGSTITNEVSALEKKDAELQSSIETVNESITALDNIYLRKTGGTVSGNLQVDSSVKLRDNNDILDIKYSDPETQELEGKTFIRYNTSANGFIDIGTSGTSGPSSITAYQAIRIKKAYNESDYKTGLIYINGSKADQIFHESNISGSKVTTNDVSGGLNITKITQSAYDGLDSKDANTLYIITE